MKTFEGSVPLVTFGATAAAIIAVVTLLHGAIVMIPTFLHSLGLIGQPDPMWYRMIWWGLGHQSQQVNVTAMVAVWYFIAYMAVGAKPLNEAVCRGAFVLYILFINIASAHHLLVDPGVGATWKIWNTSYAMYLAVLASMIHHAAGYSQIIVATQSADLIDFFDPEDVVVVERRHRSTELRRLDDAALAEWLEEYSLGELWHKNVLGGRPAPWLD
jgi:hypothetical protein